MTVVTVYDKRYSCLANYSHTHAWDNYYTKMYILSHLIKYNEYITIKYYLKQRYICTAYISINSKIYDILHRRSLAQSFKAIAIRSVTRVNLTNIKESVTYVCDYDHNRDLLLVLDWMYC